VFTSSPLLRDNSSILVILAVKVRPRHECIAQVPGNDAMTYDYDRVGNVASVIWHKFIFIDTRMEKWN
jgi:hypothetical protein